MEVAGSTVGIAGLGIQVCQGLLSYYDGWKDYGSDIASARDSIADLSNSLGLLKESLESGGLDKKRSEQTTSCLQACKGGLTDLSKKLDELRKYDEPEDLRQKACLEVQRLWYPFRKDTLTKLRANVADVRERLQLALQILQFAVQRSDRFQKIIEWLSPSDPWTNYHLARQRYEPQTGTWLLQSEQYQRWKTGVIKHLWISGKAGCGKTILCSTVIEDIQTHCEGKDHLGLAVFFFSFSDIHKQSYEDLLRSLVAQLGWREPGLSMLQRAYENRNRSAIGSDDLEKIILSSIDSFEEVFLVLDALDESPESGDIRQTMLEKVERLARCGSRLKILATSRELSEVHESMKKMKAEVISVATFAVDADIRKYVLTQLSRDRKLSRLDTPTRALVEHTISRKADGMFRWAYCQLYELKKLKSMKPKYIKDALDSLPATLDETYERMLGAIETRYYVEAITLLRWLAYSKSPPSLGQLAEAAIIDPSAKENQVDTKNRGELDDTLEILSGLVTVVEEYGDEADDDDTNDNRASADNALDESQTNASVSGTSDSDRRRRGQRKVRLAHFSVKEYLESERILRTNAKDFHLENAQGHRFLAQSCLSYLTYYHHDKSKLSTAEDLKTYPLLQYSAESWYHHTLLQDCSEVSRQVALLAPESLRRDWLLVHQPDNPWANAFEVPESVGSSVYYASYIGIDTVVQMLVDAGAEVNARGTFYNNALEAASTKGYEKVVQILVDAGAEVDARGTFHSNALEAASVEGHKKVVQILVDAGANINKQGEFYSNALQAASSSGYEKIVQILLDAGAEVNARGTFYSNALEAASAEGHEKVVQLLVDAGADINEQGGFHSNALEAASAKGYEKVVQILLDAGAEVNARGTFYRNALQAALAEGHEKVVQILIDAGADINEQGTFYSNALRAASIKGYEKVVQVLIDAGAEVNARGTFYSNALQAASAEGHEKVEQIFCSTALQAASARGHEKIVQILVDAGAEVNARGTFHSNALEAASTKGYEKVVQILLDAGAEVNARGRFYSNALQAASAGGHEKVVQILLDAGAEVNARGRFYSNALQAASAKGHEKIVQILIDAGAVESSSE